MIPSLVEGALVDAGHTSEAKQYRKAVRHLRDDRVALLVETGAWVDVNVEADGRDAPDAANSSSSAAVQTAVIRGTVTSVVQDLQLGLSGDNRFHVVSAPSDTIIVERTYTAGWVIFVCIILFPIGLLALLAPKRVDRGTVAVSEAGDGKVRLRMAGTFYKSAHSAINDVIQRGSSPQ